MANTIANLQVVIGANIASLQRNLQLALGNVNQFVGNVTAATNASGATFQRVGRGIQEVGKGFLTVGAAATAATAGIVKFGADFEKAINESVAIIPNLDAAMRDKIEKSAREVALSTRYSAAQTAEAFYFLASSGLDAAQSMEALPHVAQFAQAGLMDLAHATEFLMDAQKALGLYTKDAIENGKNLALVTDVITKAAIESNATIQQFAESLSNKAAARMRLANISIQEGTAVLAAYAEQGIKGTRAGTFFDIFIRELTRNAVENKEAFKAAGIEVFDHAGRLNNLSAIVKQLEGFLGSLTVEQRTSALAMLGFNYRSQQTTLALVGFSDRIKMFERDLRQAGGSTKEVADKQLKNFWSQLDLLKKQFIDVALAMGDQLLPALTKLVGDLKPVAQWLGQVAQSFMQLPAPVRMFFYALGPLLLTLGGIVMVVGKIVYGMGVLTIGMQAAGLSATGASVAFGAIKLALGFAGVAVAGLIAYELTSWLMNNTEWGKKLADSIGRVINALRGVNLAELERGQGPLANLNHTDYAKEIQRRAAEARAKAGLPALRTLQVAAPMRDKDGNLILGTGGLGKPTPKGAPPWKAEFDPNIDDEPVVNPDKFLAGQEAAKQHAEDLKRVMGDLTGSDTRKELDLIAEGIDKIGGVSQLAGQKIKELAEQVRQYRQMHTVRQDLGGGTILTMSPTMPAGLENFENAIDIDIPESLADLDLDIKEKVPEWGEIIGQVGLEAYRRNLEVAQSAKSAGLSYDDVKMVLKNLGVEGAVAGRILEEAFGKKRTKELVKDWDALRELFGTLREGLVALGVSADSFAMNLVVGLESGVAAAKQYAQAQNGLQKAAAVGGAAVSAYAGGSVIGGAATGAAMGTAIMPGIGTAVGAVAGGILGFLGGKSKKKKEEAAKAKQELEDFKSLGNEVIAQYGSLQNALMTANAYGVALDKAFLSKKPEQLKKALDDLAKKMNGLKDMAEGLGKVTANLTYKDASGREFSTFTDPAAVGAIASQFGSTFWHVFNKQGVAAIDQLRPAWEQLLGELEKLGLDPLKLGLGSVGQMFDLTSDPKVKALMGVSQGSAQMLRGATEGGYYDAQMVADQTTIARATLSELTASGLNADVAAKAMKEQLVALARTYEATGQEMPEDLKRAMEEAGIQLIDDQLDVLKDIRDLLAGKTVGGGNPNPKTYEADFGAASGYGSPYPVGRGAYGPMIVPNMGGGLGPLVQTHAGEGLLIVPRHKMRASFHAAAGYGVRSREEEDPDDERYGGSGGGSGSGSSSEPEPVSSAVNAQAQQIEALTSAVERLLSNPTQPVNVAISPQISINENPMANKESKEQLRQFTVDEIEQAIRLGQGSLVETIRQALGSR